MASLELKSVGSSRGVGSIGTNSAIAYSIEVGLDCERSMLKVTREQDTAPGCVVVAIGED